MRRFGTIALFLSVVLQGSCKKEQFEGRGRPREATPTAAKTPPATNKTAAARGKDAAAPQHEAEKVVKQYLRLSTEGDLRKLRPLVADHCLKTPIARATATILNFRRMTIERIETRAKEQKPHQVNVHFTIFGSFKIEGPDSELDILGRKVQMKPRSIGLEGVERTGDLTVYEISGRWRVGCPDRPKVKPGVVGEKVRGRPIWPRVPKGHAPHGPGKHRH